MDERSSIKEFLSDIELGRTNAIRVAQDLLTEGKEEVTVELSKKRIMPERMESPPRAHLFYDARGFAKYIGSNKTDNTLIVADIRAGCVTAVLDDKAGDGFEHIEMCPATFPAFEMLQAMLETQMSVAEFAQLVLRNRRVLGETEDEGKQLALLFQQLTVATEIKACTGSGRKSVSGVMCTTEIKGGAGEEQVDLPESITARVSLYVNRPEVKFEIDLTLLANSQGRVDVVADAPELKLLQYEELKKMVREVGDELDVEVAVGKLGAAAWMYNQ